MATAPNSAIGTDDAQGPHTALLDSLKSPDKVLNEEYLEEFRVG